MILDTKLAIKSVIRDVLGLKPESVCFSELDIGDYFEYFNRVFVCIGDSKAIDQDGFTVRFTHDEYVRPVKVKLEYDYILIDKDGKEIIFDD